MPVGAATMLLVPNTDILFSIACECMFRLLQLSHLRLTRNYLSGSLPDTWSKLTQVR